MYFPQSLELFVVAVSQVVLILAYVLQIKVLTNLVSPETFGLFAIVNSVISLIQLVFFSPYGMAIVKYWDSKGNSNENIIHTINKSAKKPFFTFLLFSPVLYVVTSAFNIEFGIVLSTGLASGALTGYCFILRGVFTSKRNRILVAILNLTRPIVFLSFIVTFSMFAKIELSVLFC